MDGREDVVREHTFGEQDRVFEVVTIPGHEADEDIASEGELTLVGGGAVGDDFAQLDLVTAADQRTLIEARGGVGLEELAEVVDVDTLGRLALELLVLKLGGGDFAVLRDDDTAGVGGGDDAGAFGDDDRLRVDGDATFEAGAHERGFGHDEGHALALHVGTHERAVRVVMLQERDEGGGDGDDLLRRDVHVIDVFRIHFEDVVAETDGHLALEAGGVVEFGVGLSDLEFFFLVRGHEFDLAGDLATHDLTVRSFDEAELVDTRVGGERVDEADVRTFRGLDRADTAVVGRMDVADFEASAVAVEASGPEGGETTLVRQLGERVDLVHQLGQLATREELADRIAEGLRVDELLRGDRVDALVVLVDAGLDRLDDVLEAGAALVGEELADVAHAAGTKVIDVIDRTVSGAQLAKELGGFDDVLRGDRAGIKRDVEAQLLVELVAADATEVVTERILEEALHVGAGALDVDRLAGAELAEDFLEGFFLVTDGADVLTEREDDGAVVEGGVEDAELLLRELLVDFLERLTGELVVLLGDDLTGLDVDNRVGVDELGKFFWIELEGGLGGQLAMLVEEGQDVLVVLITEGAEKGRDEELTTAAAAVEVDPEKVVLVELDFDPGAAVRNDTEGVEHLAARVGGLFEADARGAVKLGDDDALGAVDDEGAAVGDHRDFAHQDFFVLEGALLTEAELEHHRDRVGRAFADALEFGLLGQHQAVLEVLETEVAVVALHRESFAEDGVQADVLAGGRGLVQLQEIIEREDLVLDQVGRRDDFA